MWLVTTSLLSFSQNSPSLVAPPILPTWLLANQCFFKPIQVTNLHSVQEYHPTAVLAHPMPSPHLYSLTSQGVSVVIPRRTSTSCQLPCLWDMSSMMYYYSIPIGTQHPFYPSYTLAWIVGVRKLEAVFPECPSNYVFRYTLIFPIRLKHVDEKGRRNALLTLPSDEPGLESI